MIYSLGHSTLSQEQFLALVRPVKMLLDVRSHPTSKWPHFNKDQLADWLTSHGVDYVWEPNLGGWSERHLHHRGWAEQRGVAIDVYAAGHFPKQRIALASGKSGPAWTNLGLLDYSWFMATPEFLRAAEQLLMRGQAITVGIMCAEATWWRCHRSMIADYLYYRGVTVQHLLGKRAQPHPIGDRLQRYDPEIRAVWDDMSMRQ